MPEKNLDPSLLEEIVGAFAIGGCVMFSSILRPW